MYYEHGLGETTIVLCHPVTAGLAVFQPLLERLCQDFRIVMCAPRGTGKSDPLPGPYYTADFAEDLRAVVESASDRPVVEVGHSRGATVGTHFTTSYPHLVDKLVLAGLAPAGPSWVADHPEADLVDRAFAGRLAAALATDDWAEVTRVFMTQVSAGETGTRKLVDGAGAAWSQVPLPSLRNFFALDDPGRDVRALLPKIRVPTLVLHGEVDRVSPLEMARRTVERIPGAQFQVLAGRSLAMLATPTAEFAELVRRFVRTGEV